MFIELREHLDHLRAASMRDLHGITTDQQAIAIILRHIDDVRESGAYLDRAEFTVHFYLHRVVERVIEVVVSALRVLTPATIAPCDKKDIRRLQALAGKTRVLGEPLTVDEMWEVVDRILPALEKNLQYNNLTSLACDI